MTMSVHDGRIEIQSAPASSNRRIHRPIGKNRRQMRGRSECFAMECWSLDKKQYPSLHYSTLAARKLLTAFP